MLHRKLVILFVIALPYYAWADALGGIRVLYDAYAIIAFLVAIMGLVILSMAKPLSRVSVFGAIICVGVGFPCLDLFNRWGFEMEFITPFFSFIMGVILVIRILLQYTTKIKE